MSHPHPTALRRRFRRLLCHLSLLSLLSLPTLSACHTRSRFITYEGTVRAGTVVSSTSRQLVLKGRRGEEFWVAHNDVASVRWAGTPATIVGGSIVGAGVVSLGVTVAVSLDNSSEDLGIVGAVMAGTLIGSGLIPLIWGLVTTADARAKAQPSVSPPSAEATGIAPEPSSTDRGWVWAPWWSASAGGLGLSGRF